MRYNFIFFLVISPLLAISQDFFTNRMEPMLTETERFIDLYPEAKLHVNWPCPPKLKKAQKTAFSFLDSLQLNPDFEEEFLLTFFDAECAGFYHMVMAHSLFYDTYIEALKDERLPEKYALLPLTLSGSNPTLKYTEDKSGAWQLSFVTGRKYGLQISPYLDERNNVTLASKAASKYLRFLESYYLNNELLVITAFYTSVPFVNKQLKSANSTNAQEFFNQLPPHVQGYFSYLKTWNNWIQNFNLSQAFLKIDSANIWVPSPVKDTLSFEVISKIAEVEVSTLKLQNPVWVGDAVYPNMHQSLFLPPNKAKSFTANYAHYIEQQKELEIIKAKELAELKKRMEQGIPDLNKYVAITYTVKSGDVLGKIATNYSVKVNQIKQWNNLSSDRISIGQKLTIYVPKGFEIQEEEEDTADNKIDLKPKPSKPGKGTPTIYTVKSGDSLWLIAKKFPGVSAENIMEWNGISEKISPGQQLKIYAPQ